MGALLANLTTCHSMKSATFETTPEETGKSHSGLVRDLVELVKARLTLLVLLTTAVGFYVGAYTTLKRISTFNTALGAGPGALPPMIGWAAARGTLNAGAWTLFAILFFWQLPHFFAIAWMYRDDYARAGFQMISSDDRTGERSASQSVFFCMLLFVVAGLPAFLGIATVFYLLAELILGAVFVAVAMRFFKPSA